MKIGIGVTSYKRPQHLSLWINQVKTYTSNTEIFVAEDTDTDRMGIAYRKNQCLKALKDCDYIFLFDDDCLPISDGWVEYFIDYYNITGQHHFLYLKETTSIKLLGTIKYISNEETKLIGTLMVKAFVLEKSLLSYSNSGGCFMFMTKEVIEKVGGFNPNYGIYGFEHAGYSNRIHAAGLTPIGKYLCPSEASKYIYSMDYDNHLSFNKQVDHKSSIDIMKADEYIHANRKIYDTDTQIYWPL